ncbi:hypothetical protein TNIN_107691 [Trichonephila inaurata madagascariensis]|uniref:Uncharacterized protein n=1 Tax=Trichonephila inaurata madagascariensis TaxID=2747483 RepID=A0A8X6Y5U1_9ARAC|nr:hypothetical protein TNIN_107691 [Trichonephila inaurata madagascariensis]
MDSHSMKLYAAKPHFSVQVWAGVVIGHQWVRHSEPVTWPPCSRDLSSTAFFLWGCTEKCCVPNSCGFQNGSGSKNCLCCCGYSTKFRSI